MSTAAKADSKMATTDSATRWASFNWEDPFRFEEQLTDDERLVADTARQFAQEQLAPRVQEAYRDEITDPAIFREMGELLRQLRPDRT
jgi:glutaryl-CoA dehydrogenase